MTSWTPACLELKMHHCALLALAVALGEARKWLNLRLPLGPRDCRPLFTGCYALPMISMTVSMMPIGLRSCSAKDLMSICAPRDRMCQQGLRCRFRTESNGGPLTTMQMMLLLPTVSHHLSARPPAVHRLAATPSPAGPHMQTPVTMMMMRSNLWVDSIAFVPFWCLDAKGGEMALLGFSGICMGRA